MKRNRIFFIFAFLLAACDGELMVTPGTAKQKTPTIETLDKVSAKPGDQISFAGRNLNADMEISVGGVPATFILDDETKGSFIVPEGEGINSEGGLMQVSFSMKNKRIVNFPLLNSDVVDSLPTVSVSEGNICNTVVYKNEARELVRGKANCAVVPSCKEDGETGCLANNNYPAALVSGAATKILTGQTLAGVSGSATSRPSDCASDGATGCVAVSAYPAVDKGSLQTKAAKIRSSVAIAGISGNLGDCASDGAADCVVLGPTYAAALLTGAGAKIALGQSLAGVSGTAGVRPGDCAADGATNCVAVSNYPAIDKSNLTTNASKIRDSFTIAGIAGSLSDCAADGTTSCVAVGNFPAVDKINKLQANASKIRSGVTIAGVAGTLANCSSDGGAGCVAVGPSYAAALLTGAAAKIVIGQSLAGVAGNAATRPSDCANDGDIGCVAVSNFPAVNKNIITSNLAKIQSTLMIAGVSGTLDNCSSDGATACVAVTSFPAIDKTALASNASKIRSSLSLVSVNGTLADCTADGAAGCVAVNNFPAVDTSTAAAKILTGQTLAGVAGTAAERPADCAADGALDCVSVAAYPAMDSSAAAAKILSGQSIAGVSGTAPLRPADCAADGSVGCVTVNNYPSVDKAVLTSNAAKIRDSVTIATVTGSLGDCSMDGDTGCVAIGPAYAAALLTGAAAKIASGQMLAGVSGSAPAKPADCASDGDINCVAVANYPATNGSIAAAKIVSGQTVAGITGTATGVRPSDCASDGELGCVSITAFPAMQVAGAAAKIAAGDTLAGITGTASARPSDCTLDGAIGCVAVANYPAVDKSALTSNASKIQNSLSIAGVSGTLANCSTDGGTSCVAVAAYPAAKVVGSAAKILTGQSVAGISGSAAVKPADCAADGETGCVTVTNYPSVDKAALTSNANKIRSSLTIASIAGTLANCSVDGGIGCVAVATFPAANSTGAAAKILTGQTLAGINGTGAGRPADCAVDGSIGCVTVTNYPSVDKIALTSNAGKIRSGTSVASVNGSLADCSADGGVSCVAVTAYPAANSSGAAAKILTGQTLAGIPGTAAVKPADCSTDGGIGCVTGNNYPSVDKSALSGNAGKIRSGTSVAGVSGSLADCNGDGDMGCVTVTAYPAALASGADAKILTGQTLAGIPGSAALRPADCSSEGGTSCVAVTNFPAVDKVNNITANAGKIRSSVTIVGVAGSLSDCNSDNGSGCVASSNYPSVVKANVSAGVIKSGTVIAGVTGAYPTSTYPLTASDGYNDLDAATFNTKIKASSNFGWFDRNGTRYSTTGDADLAAENISVGVDIFGTTGTFGANCTADGQTGCTTTSRYKSMDTDSTVISAWDIRSGKSAGGIPGNLVFYKNTAKLTKFNRTSGSGASSSSSVADIYDTIDDYNDGSSSMPSDVPSGWTAPGSNWLRDSLSDSNSNGTCNSGEDCVYKDQTTGLLWSKTAGSTYSWSNGISYCVGLNYGGYSNGWRLPTQKELYQAHIDGIWGMKTALGLTTLWYWTSTTFSSNTSEAYNIDIGNGAVSPDGPKSGSGNILCVR